MRMQVKILGVICLERDYKFLVIDAERVGGVQLHPWIKMPDADVLVHQPLAFFQGKQVPRARLPERVNEDVLLAARANAAARVMLAFVLMTDEVL
jgi:hypothetical protein